MFKKLFKKKDNFFQPDYTVEGVIINICLVVGIVLLAITLCIGGYEFITLMRLLF